MHALYARAADLPPLTSTGDCARRTRDDATIANVGGTWRLGLSVRLAVAALTLLCTWSRAYALTAVELEGRAAGGGEGRGSAARA